VTGLGFADWMVPSLSGSPFRPCPSDAVQIVYRLLSGAGESSDDPDAALIRPASGMASLGANYHIGAAVHAGIDPGRLPRQPGWPERDEGLCGRKGKLNAQCL
jgi:hypothetical protein